MVEGILATESKILQINYHTKLDLWLRSVDLSQFEPLAAWLEDGRKSTLYKLQSLR